MATSYFTYNAVIKKPGNPWIHLPAETQCLIRINSAEFFGQSEIGASNILRHTEGWPPFRKAVSGLLKLDSLFREEGDKFQGISSSEILFALSPYKDSWEMVMLCDASMGLTENKWLEILEKTGSVQQGKADGSLHIVLTGGEELFVLFKNKLMGVAGSQNGLEILKTCLDKTYPGSYINEKKQEMSTKVAISIMIENRLLEYLMLNPSGLPDPKEISGEASAWCSFDVVLKRDEIFLSGFPEINDSSKVLKNCATSSMTAFPLYIPSEAMHMMTLSIDFKGTNDTVDSLVQTESTLRGEFWITALKGITPADNVYLINASDSAGIKQLSNATARAKDKLFLARLFKQVSAFFSATDKMDSVTLFLVQMNESWLIGQNEEKVRRISAAVRNRQIITKEAWFRDVSDNLPDSAAIWGSINFKNYLNSEGSPAYANHPIHSLAWAIIPGTKPLMSVTLSSLAGASTPSVRRNTRLAGKITHRPYPVWDHKNMRYNLLVFDDLGTASLFNPEGEILWDYKLDGLLMGDIQVVDAYKNNKFQYLFNTAQSMYLLDLNGNDVEGFPLSIPEGASNALVAFDYDGRKDYRIFVVGKDKTVRNYDLRGKEVKGWNDPKIGSAVTTPLQHIAMYGKDYIIIASDNGEVVMTDRQGDIRVRIKRSFTNNPLTPFFMQRIAGETRIITTDNKGNIRALLRNGKVKNISIEEMSPDHRFTYESFSDARENDYIFFDNSTLSVFNKDGARIYETQLAGDIHQGPSVLSTGSARYLCVADSSAGEIYFFKDGMKDVFKTIKAKFIPTIIDLDQDLKPELVSADDHSLIIQVLEE